MEKNSQVRAADQRDRELLDAIAAGCLGSFSQLYKNYYFNLIKLVHRYLGSAESVEEVVNDTMLAVWQGAAAFRGESRVSTWMMGIAIRKSAEKLRIEKRQNLILDDTWINDAQTIDMLSDMTRTDALNWALLKLSAAQRATLELAYYGGYTCEEIADIFQCPANTVKTRLHYARKALRRIFECTDNSVNYRGLMGE